VDSLAPQSVANAIFYIKPLIRGPAHRSCKVFPQSSIGIPRRKFSTFPRKLRWSPTV